MTPVKDLIKRVRTLIHDNDCINYDDRDILHTLNAGLRFMRRTISEIQPELLMTTYTGILQAGEDTIELQHRPMKIIEMTAGDKIISSVENFAGKKIFSNFDKVFGNTTRSCPRYELKTFNEYPLEETTLHHIRNRNKIGQPEKFYRVGLQSLKIYPKPRAETAYTLRTIDDMLVVTEEKNIHLADFQGRISREIIGSLNGDLYLKYISWEDGVLIASGAQLQYFNGADFVTLDSPPAEDVFIRDGRVVVTFKSVIRFSGIGDENNWLDDSNVESASKFVEVGYKDGGNFIGAANLSQDILILKDNRKCYRMTGNFPEWQISEIADQIECGGRRSYCSVGDDVFVLGAEEACLIQRNFYGNVKPLNLGAQIKSELHRLPKNSQVRFVPPLYQVWIIGKGGFVLVYDIRFRSWWRRQFNADVLDVFNDGNEVFIVKRDRISKLDKGTFKDNEKFLSWKFLTQRLVSHHDYLLKRTRVSVIPLSHEHYDGQIFCGRVVIPLPIPDREMQVHEDDSPIYRNKTKLHGKGRLRGYLLPQLPNEKIFWSEQFLPDNRHKIFANNTFELISRNVFRSHYLDVGGRGAGGRFVLQSIIMDIAEV